MQDLNDLYYFAQVVRHGGFSAASRALRIPKSRLSRRIAQLEERLGVRLLQCSTRQVVLTDVGETYYWHCQTVVENVRAAQEAVELARSAPQKPICISCPVALAQFLLVDMVAEFMHRHPRVCVRVIATDGEVNLIEEGLALSIHMRFMPLADSGLIARHLGSTQFILVAHPQYLERHGRPRYPEDLTSMDCLHSTYLFDDRGWPLMGPDGTTRTVVSETKMAANDLVMLKRAAVLGMGVAALPRQLCASALEQGKLERVLPGWALPDAQVHLIYPSHRGMVPAVRSLIDFIVERFPALL